MTIYRRYDPKTGMLYYSGTPPSSSEKKKAKKAGYDLSTKRPYARARYNPKTGQTEIYYSHTPPKGKEKLVVGRARKRVKKSLEKLKEEPEKLKEFKPVEPSLKTDKTQRHIVNEKGQIVGHIREDETPQQAIERIKERLQRLREEKLQRRRIIYTKSYELPTDYMLGGEREPTAGEVVLTYEQDVKSWIEDIKMQATLSAKPYKSTMMLTERKEPSIYSPEVTLLYEQPAPKTWYEKLSFKGQSLLEQSHREYFGEEEPHTRTLLKTIGKEAAGGVLLGVSDVISPFVVGKQLLTGEITVMQAVRGTYEFYTKELPERLTTYPVAGLTSLGIWFVAGKATGKVAGKAKTVISRRAKTLTFDEAGKAGKAKKKAKPKTKVKLKKEVRKYITREEARYHAKIMSTEQLRKALRKIEREIKELEWKYKDRLISKEEFKREYRACLRSKHIILTELAQRGEIIAFKTKKGIRIYKAPEIRTKPLVGEKPMIAPVIRAKPTPKAKQREKTFIVPLSKEKAKQREKEEAIIKPVIDTTQKSRVSEVIKEKTMLESRVREEAIETQIEIVLSEEVTLTEEVGRGRGGRGGGGGEGGIGPPPPPPILGAGGGLGGGGRWIQKKSSKRKRKTKYAPSVLGALKGIKITKPPKYVTGVGIRGVLVEKRK
ncbi:hypothetical protein J7J18_04435 [bacterium]|nr:hypothetical protein [bacterium]